LVIESRILAWLQWKGFGTVFHRGEDKMDIAILDRPMARKRTSSKDEPKKGGTMIRVTEEVAEALRKVCALKNMTAAEFSEAYYLPVIEQCYRELIAAESKRISGRREH
jgi:hypothetical protein